MTWRKALVATIISAAGALATALGTGNDSSLGKIDTLHWILAVLFVLGSGGIVWWCENGPWHTYFKTVVALLTAGLGSLVMALNDSHISQAEWVTAFTAAAVAAAGVFQATNLGSVQFGSYPKKVGGRHGT